MKFFSTVLHQRVLHDVMREALRRRLDQLAVQEFDPLVLAQDPGFQHQPQVAGREATGERAVGRDGDGQTLLAA